MRHRVLIAAALASAFLLTATVSHAVDPGVKCDAGKLKEAGNYASCCLKAESKAISQGGSPDYSACDSKFTQKYAGLETQAGPGACSTEGNVSSVAGCIRQAATDCGGLATGAAATTTTTLPAGGSCPAGDQTQLEQSCMTIQNNLSCQTCCFNDPNCTYSCYAAAIPFGCAYVSINRACVQDLNASPCSAVCCP